MDQHTTHGVPESLAAATGQISEEHLGMRLTCIVATHLPIALS